MGVESGAYDQEHWDFNLARQDLTPQWAGHGSHIVQGVNRELDRRKESLIYTVALDKSSLVAIPPANASYFIDHSPSLSPDGTSFVYSTYVQFADGDTAFNLKASTLDGQEQVEVTDGNGLDLQPLWSPEGDSLLYFRGTNRDLCNAKNVMTGIYTASNDGSGAERVYDFTRLDRSLFDIALDPAESEKLVFGGGLTWSPDGQSFTLLLDERDTIRDQNDGHFVTVARSGLYVMSADGSKVHKVLEEEEQHDARKPSPYSPFVDWSPDGQKIAFLSREGGWATLYTIAEDGSGRIGIGKLFPDIGGISLREGSLSWSPDGSRILVALRGMTEYVRGYTFVGNADGSAGMHIGDTAYASWSPDGSRIAAVRLDAGMNRGTLLTMAPDGSDERLLAFFNEQGEGEFVDGTP